MATTYIGINNQSKKVNNIYVGIGNESKKVLKGYVGIDGKAKLFYTSNRLPEGYQEVRYIKVNSEITNYKIYVNSGMTLKQNPRIVVDFTSESGCYGSLFGVYAYYSGNTYIYHAYINDGKINFQYGTYSSLNFNQQISITHGRHQVDFNKYENDKSNFYFDNTLIGSSSIFSNNIGYVIYLMDKNNPNSNATNNYKIKYHNFKIYDNTNNLLKDFIPCYDNIRIGFYDLVNSDFKPVASINDSDIEIGPNV